MTTYRLVRWLRLGGEFDQLKFRRALTAMSVGPVTSRQLRDASGLRRTEVALLLRVLATAEVLTVEPDVKAAPHERVDLAAHCDIDLPMEPGTEAWAVRATLTFA